MSRAGRRRRGRWPSAARDLRSRSVGTIGEDERDGGGPGRVDASRFAKGGRNKIEWSGPAPLSPRVTSRAPSGARVGLTPTAGRGQARVHLHERALHDDRAPLLSRYRLCARDAPVSGASVNAKVGPRFPRSDYFRPTVPKTRRPAELGPSPDALSARSRRRNLRT